MITFGPMPPLAAALRRASLLLPFLAVSTAGAQATLSHLDDAAPIPAGMLRLRVSQVWTRWDERFSTVNGTTPLGVELSADSLGSAQLPRLSPIEAQLRVLAADPALRLSLGRLQVGSNARISTTPIALEYGLTSRLSVGVRIPVVQTRRVAMATVTGDNSWANLGFVPTAQRSGAAQTNLAVANAYQSAADSLGRLIANCPANPGAAGCAAVNANGADAAAARARALSYANAVKALGTTPANVVVAPRATSTLVATLDARRVQLNQQLQQYLGAGAGSAAGVFTAGTDFSYIDLQGSRGLQREGLLQGALGGGLDSIHTTERIGFGDIAVGAQLMVFDRFSRDDSPPPRLQTRLAVGGAVRLPTSRVDSAQSLVDIPTGDGAGIEVHSAWDVIVRRFGGTVAARYVKSFARTVQAPLLGDPEAPFPYPLFGLRRRTAGSVLQLDLTPRYLLSESLAIDAHYGFERSGATTYDAPDVAVAVDPCIGCQSPPVVTAGGTARSAQRVGLGLRYSTVDSYARGRARYPIEVSLTHLATATGDDGLPNQSRDQIQVRLFYRILQRR
jgi:hypothetical protein